MSIKNVLSNLGIRDEEYKTYLELLESGSLTASQLAKKLSIPRPSVYGFLERLAEKGLIKESKNINDIKTFTAEPPDKLRLIYDQKLEELRRQEDELELLLPELIAKQSPLMVPSFHLYRGKEGMKHVLKDALLYSNLQTYSYWPISDMVEVLTPEFLHWLNIRRIRQNIWINTIWPANKAKTIDLTEHLYMGIGKKMMREIRIAPKHVDYSMGYWIYGKKVMFVSSKKEGFGFIIESAELVEMLLSQYEILWNLSKPVKMDEKIFEPFLEEVEHNQ